MTMLTWKGGLSNSGETWKTLLPSSLWIYCFFLFCLCGSRVWAHSSSHCHKCTFRHSVNANEAFSHTKWMYPLRFTNVLPFRCHLLCCWCEYIVATTHHIWVVGLKLLSAVQVQKVANILSAIIPACSRLMVLDLNLKGNFRWIMDYMFIHTTE